MAPGLAAGLALAWPDPGLAWPRPGLALTWPDQPWPGLSLALAWPGPGPGLAWPPGLALAWPWPWPWPWPDGVGYSAWLTAPGLPGLALPGTDLAWPGLALDARAACGDDSAGPGLARPCVPTLALAWPDPGLACCLAGLATA
jgi:hypothetical protein